jgi:Na+/H+-dicarboxylate symporter
MGGFSMEQDKVNSSGGRAAGKEEPSSDSAPAARKPSFLKSYGFSLMLLGSIIVGSLLGALLKENAKYLKPFGDIFLNLLFTLVVPLVFFSISSAVSDLGGSRRLGRILVWMLVIFIGTGIVSSIIMITGVTIFPPAAGVKVGPGEVPDLGSTSVAQQIVGAFTASDFVNILSRKSMLALIIFAGLVGLGVSVAGEKGKPFAAFLASGNQVMSKVIGFVLLYAPIGLGAYFGYLVGTFGPQLMGSYFRAIALYYPIAIVYFFAAFTIYTVLAGGVQAARAFWLNIIPASLTALATGSSLATIPTNLRAATGIGIPKDVREVVIPVGATIHMEGSCLAAILKISFLFGIYGMSFSGAGTVATAIGVAILAGTVMSGIPGGGFLGELLIVTVYGFPPEALPLISMIGTLVDPPATMVNATGDAVSSMLIARILNGRRWREKPGPAA